MTAGGAPISPTFPVSSHSAKRTTRSLPGFNERSTRTPRRCGRWAKRSPLRPLRPAPCRPPEEPRLPAAVQTGTPPRRLQGARADAGQASRRAGWSRAAALRLKRRRRGRGCSPRTPAVRRRRAMHGTSGAEARAPTVALMKCWSVGRLLDGALSTSELARRRATATTAAPGGAAARRGCRGIAGSSTGDLPGPCISRPRSPRSLVVVRWGSRPEVRSRFCFELAGVCWLDRSSLTPLPHAQAEEKSFISVASFASRHGLRAAAPR